MKIDIPCRKRKLVAQLIDPDKYSDDTLFATASRAAEVKVDLFLAGGSLTGSSVSHLIARLKQLSTIPVVLFPGNLTQLTDTADAVFLLSLISGRNPELLIGNHVIAAPFLRQSCDRCALPEAYQRECHRGGVYPGRLRRPHLC